MNNLFKLALLGLGGYILYEYFYGPSTGMTATNNPGIAPATRLPVTPVTTNVPPLQLTTVQPGTTGSGSTGSVPVAPVSAQPLVSSTLQTQMQQLANAGGIQPNPDEWLYYFTQITGIVPSGVQTENVLSALGLNDSTRNTAVPISNMLAAMTAAGLLSSGMGGLGLMRINPPKLGWYSVN